MPELTPSEDPIGRAIVAAAVTAPLPALLLSLYGLGIHGLIMGMFAFFLGVPVALLHVLLIGAPVYRQLRRRCEVGVGLSALAGFVSGALPILLLTRTSGIVIFAGICGLSGGIAFGIVLRMART